MRSGETVAVKVQHRAVRAHSFVDINTMEVLVRIAAKTFPDFKLIWLLDEMKKNIPAELDFINEGHNAEQLKKFMSDCDWLKVSLSYYFFLNFHIKFKSYNLLIQKFPFLGFLYYT